MIKCCVASLVIQVLIGFKNFKFFRTAKAAGPVAIWGLRAASRPGSQRVGKPSAGCEPLELVRESRALRKSLIP